MTSSTRGRTCALGCIIDITDEPEVISRRISALIFSVVNCRFDESGNSFLTQNPKFIDAKFEPISGSKYKLELNTTVHYGAE